MHDFDERLFRSKTNLDDIRRLLMNFTRTPLYVRSDNRQDPLLIVYDRENRVSKRNHHLCEIGVHLQDLLKVVDR
jgi:hypothetical protein